MPGKAGSIHAMNEKAVTIRLRDFMQSSDAWGHDEGREVFLKLLRAVEGYAGYQVFRISLEGVRRTDASFPRECVIELAKRYRGAKGFCLSDAGNQDLLDNWEMAADKKEQPIIYWKEDSSYRIIGPQPSRGNQEIFDYVLSVPYATAVSAAKILGLKLTNASTKLKMLCGQGFLLRRDEPSPSGGIEYIYFGIK